MTVIGGSAVGLNTAKISAMEKALTDYITAINKNVNIAANRANIQKAIKGSASEASIIALNKQIDTQFADLVNKLNQFKNILAEMKETYTKNDASNTSFSSAMNSVKGE